MANAKKCDRCGTFFVVDEKDRNVETLYTKIRVRKKHDRHGFVDLYETTLLDLCANCSDDFSTWFRERTD